MAKEIQREKTIQSRVTEEEFDIIEKKANSLGLSVSNYVRMVCLHCDIKVALLLRRPEFDKKDKTGE